MRLGVAVLAGSIAVALTSGCPASDTDRTGAAIPRPTAAPSGAAEPAGVPFSLYTHCGINELYADGRYFQRVEAPLTNGEANPPPGWENPEQPGWLLNEGDVAIFTDDAGHREVFEEREGASDFLQICL